MFEQPNLKIPEDDARLPVSKDVESFANEIQGKSFEKNRSEKTVSVFEMIDFLAKDEDLQNKIFRHGLTDEMIDQMKKEGISSGLIVEISKKMGLREFTVDELKALEKSVPTFDTKSYDPYDSETPELKP